MNYERGVRGWGARALLCALLCCGCGYGEISPTAYEYAKAIYSLSNRRAADKLSAVEAQIAAAAESGQLPPHEAAWLNDFCDDCRAGRWKDAQEASRQMMEDQVRR